jgi:hypothetical protein
MSPVKVGKALTFLIAPAFLLSFALAADHPDFTGSWKLNSNQSKIKDSKLATECSKLTIEQKETEISLSEADGLAIRCSIAGKDCANKSSKVSFWFNGPKLVQMEYTGHSGEHVRKRRLSLSPDGNTLQMEVIPISPAGDTSLLAFDKTP